MVIFAGEQFKKELRSLIERWKEESDLGDPQIVQCAVDALNEFNNEIVVDFEADADIFNDESSRHEEGGNDI